MEKKVVGTLLALAMCASTVFAAPANEVNVTVPQGSKVNVSVQNANVAGSVHWGKAEDTDIIVSGTGMCTKYTGTKARLLARRAAIVDAYRYLAEQVQGVQVDGDSTVADLETQSDVVRTKVSALVKGAKIIKEEQMSDGAYVVTMAMPMFGASSLASAVMPEVMKDTPVAEPPEKVTAKNTVMPKEEFKQVVKEVKANGYTGVVIDAVGRGLECTMAPQILDTNGRVVYGKANIDVDFAVSHGLVEYSKDLQGATGGTSRAGSNPLVIKATAVKGGSNSVNPVNVVVSPEDADKILLAASNNANLMRNGSVVFVR